MRITFVNVDAQPCGVFIESTKLYSEATLNKVSNKDLKIPHTGDTESLGVCG